MAAQGIELVNFITPPWLRPVLMVDALGFYLYKLVFPLWLGVDYGRSAEWVATEGWRQFVWLIPCGVAPLIWFGSKRRPWLIAASALFVIGILPVSGLLLFAFQNISNAADRYLYFSMLGPAMALAFFLSERSDKPVIAVTVLVLSLWSLKSVAQIQIWRDENSLFSHALHLNPASWVSRNNLAYYLSRHGKLEDAITQYKLVLQQKPEHVDAITNLGSIYARQGKLDEAIAQYQEALRIHPVSAPAHTGLANILASRGEIDEAIRHYREALKSDSEDFEARQNLGNLLFNKGQNEAAIEHFMSALQGNSASADVYNNLAIALAKTGRVNEAIDYLRSALRANPNDADTHNNLGIALAGTGQIEDGAEHFREAVRLRPDFYQAHENLSRALAVLGNVQEAGKEHQEAQRIEQLQRQKR
jgi:tetratricopeptide (TPR) repeat protein